MTKRDESRQCATPKHSRAVAVFLARVRIPLIWLNAVLLVVGVATRTAWVFFLLPFLLLFSLAVYFRVGTLHDPDRVVAPPVVGRWLALNSPETRVPSHGLHAYGQTYAIDLVFEPAAGARPAMGWRPLFRDKTEFPAFGQAVLAPADGTVVRARQRGRDHRARSSWPGLAYLIIESSLRELTGPGRILGNHLVLRLDDGTYGVLAHLQRNSIVPRVGERVRAGQLVAHCGNSGNTSEPHVHFQVMDSPHVLFAGGLPIAFDDIDVDDVHKSAALPGNGQAMVAPSEDRRGVGGS